MGLYEIYNTLPCLEINSLAIILCMRIEYNVADLD
jgi:hypothetical protein